MNCWSDDEYKQEKLFRLSPSAKKTPWSQEEDMYLLEMVSKYGNQWQIIASKMNGRTHHQCKSRFFLALNPSAKRGKWTMEEDKNLVALQSKYGNKWTIIALMMNGRTDEECRSRWIRRLDPSVNNDLWSKEEDKRLLELCSKHGHNWTAIAAEMNGRTGKQCSERWRLSLDPTIKKGRWTEEEDANLLKFHLRYGNNWLLISSKMNGRTEHQCSRRVLRKLNPSKKRTRWSEEEHRCLLELYSKYGDDWNGIASKMTGMTNLQQRESSLLTSKSLVTKDNWTEEEDKHLLELHYIYDNKWSDIAKNLPGKSKTQCKERFFIQKYSRPTNDLEESNEDESSHMFNFYPRDNLHHLVKGKKRSNTIWKLNINGGLYTGYLIKSVLSTPIKSLLVKSPESISIYEVVDEDGVVESKKWGACFNLGCKIVLLEPFPTQFMVKKIAMLILQNYHNDLFDYARISNLNDVHQPMDLTRFIAKLKAA